MKRQGNEIASESTPGKRLCLYQPPPKKHEVNEDVDPLYFVLVPSSNALGLDPAAIDVHLPAIPDDDRIWPSWLRSADEYVLVQRVAALLMVSSTCKHARQKLPVTKLRMRLADARALLYATIRFNQLEEGRTDTTFRLASYAFIGLLGYPLFLPVAPDAIGFYDVFNAVATGAGEDPPPPAFYDVCPGRYRDIQEAGYDAVRWALFRFRYGYWRMDVLKYLFATILPRYPIMSALLGGHRRVLVDTSTGRRLTEVGYCPVCKQATFSYGPTRAEFDAEMVNVSNGLFTSPSFVWYPFVCTRGCSGSSRSPRCRDTDDISVEEFGD